MLTFHRPQHKILIEKLSKPPRDLIIITGPRQVGKTTLVHDVINNHLHLPDGVAPPIYKSLDEPVTITGSDSGDTSSSIVQSPDLRWLVGVWEEARIEAQRPDRSVPHVLVLDEIQNLNQWHTHIKGLWDTDRLNKVPLHVILLGSSPLLVDEGLSKLNGRFRRILLNHWTYSEIKAAFGMNLHEYLFYGGYPRVGEYKIDQELDEWLPYVKDSLIDPTVEKDVLMMHKVEKPALLSQLFELGCLYSGQIVSYSKLVGGLDEANNQNTLADYLKLLGNAGLLKGLHRYARGHARKRKSPPKLQVLNTALMSAMHDYSYQEAQDDTAHWGRLVESAVGAHLHNSGDSHTRLYYWRENGHEVDFVVERNQRSLAIEVKSTDKPASMKGLDAFSKRFPEAGRLIVGSTGVPLEEFLQSGLDDWFSWGSS